MRRMNALATDLSQAVPKKRRSALKFWDVRLTTIVARSFADGEDRLEASQEGRQGFGVPRQHSPVDVAFADGANWCCLVPTVIHSHLLPALFIKGIPSESAINRAQCSRAC